MPNHVTSQITFNHADPKSILSQLSGDKSAFDFHRLVPMPESLEVESGSQGERAMEYLIAVAKGYPSDQVARAEQWLDENPIAKALGQQYLMNIAQHGHTTWYGWRNKHWGTKWGAYEVNVVIDGNQVTITFQTAWSPPWPIIAKLTEIIPTFDLVYVDEAPNFWGKASYVNGKEVRHSQNCDDELAQLKLDLLGESE